MDSSIDNVFCIFDEQGKHVQFYWCPITKLYCLDLSVSTNWGFLLSVVTVNGQEQHFSVLYCTCERSLRKLQHIMAYPSDYDLFGPCDWTQCDRQQCIHTTWCEKCQGHFWPECTRSIRKDREDEEQTAKRWWTDWQSTNHSAPIQRHHLIHWCDASQQNIFPTF